MKYQGTDIQIGAFSVPNIFSVGNIGIKPEVLQAAENAIKLLDLRHFQNCENLKEITDQATKTTFIDNMNKQQDKLSNIAMAIDAYKINPNSQKLEETLTNLLQSDLPLSGADKEEVTKKIEVNVSQKVKEAENLVGADIEEISEGSVKVDQDVDKANGVTGVKVGRLGKRSD